MRQWWRTARLAAELPPYGLYVAEQVRRLGRDHPLIKTQYYLEQIDAEGGLFPSQRQSHMHGVHPRQHQPTPGKIYALLVDVGGAEEGATGVVGVERTLNARRDATACTIVEIDTSTVSDPLIRLPTYKVVDRKLWLGVSHTTLHAQLIDLVTFWGAYYIVVDATGVGAGLSQFLTASLGPRVIPVVFTSPSKTNIGWGFISVIDTGRYKDYAADGASDTAQFWYEVGACEYRVNIDGSLRWGVWDTPRYDGFIARGHDDLLISAALCVLLDGVKSWGYGPSAVIEAPDYLGEIDRGTF